MDKATNDRRRARISDAMRGVPKTPEHRAAIAAGVRARRDADMRNLVDRVERIVDRVEALNQEDDE